MTTVNEHKISVLNRLKQMSGKYSSLARASGCDPSTVAKLAKRAQVEDLDKVDMSVMTLSRLEQHFAKDAKDDHVNPSSSEAAA